MVGTLDCAVKTQGRRDKPKSIMDAIQKTICTSCGAPNLIKEGEQEYFCSHCGGKNYLVRQDEERTSIQSPDETRQPKAMETEALSSNSELNAGIEASQRTTGADVPQDARPYEWKTNVGWSVFGMACGYVFWQVVGAIIILLITLAYSETGREFDQNAISAMAVLCLVIFFLPLCAYIHWLDGAVRQQRRIKNSAVSFFNCFFGSIPSAIPSQGVKPRAHRRKHTIQSLQSLPYPAMARSWTATARAVPASHHCPKRLQLLCQNS